MRDMAPTCIDTFSYCQWRNRVRPCHELFKPVFTEKGLCFAFNALNSHETFTNEWAYFANLNKLLLSNLKKYTYYLHCRMAPEMFTITDNPNITNWNQEYGYTKGRIGSEHPLRIFDSKPFGGLTIYVRLLKCDMAYECRGPFHGFTLSLSPPEDMISLSNRLIRVSPCEKAKVSIRPKLIFSLKNVEKYTPVERQCYKNAERQLRYFKFYGKNNCEMECLANFTKKECGCVKFSMPSMNFI